METKAESRTEPRKTQRPDNGSYGHHEEYQTHGIGGEPRCPRSRNVLKLLERRFLLTINAESEVACLRTRRIFKLLASAQDWKELLGEKMRANFEVDQSIAIAVGDSYFDLHNCFDLIGYQCLPTHRKVFFEWGAD